MFALHQTRWTGKGHEGAFASPESRAFHREFAAALLSENKLRLYLLWMNEKPVAALECFRHHGDLCYYQGGFSPDYADYSPAKALIAHAIQDAIGKGCTTFDFLKGDEGYKSKWGSVVQQTYRMVLCPKRPLSLLALEIIRLHPKLKAMKRSDQK